MFIDILQPNVRLILIGAGNVALSLTRLADIVGFRLTVIDDDCALANKERFPMAKRIVSAMLSKQ